LEGKDAAVRQLQEVSEDMRADIRQIAVEPFQVYDIIVEVTDGDDYQIYRQQWRYVEGGTILTGEGDGGDPRRAIGKALQELGRSLELSHGHKLVVPPPPPGGI
jgi:hypothetical protein